ncbi:MAG: fructose-6-phosphate aldolase [Planctomycetota bacterium]
MEFFIDTADVKEIEEALALGILDGVTTNPSLIRKSGRDYIEVLKEILEIVPGPVSCEVLATDLDGILAEGRYLASLGDNAVVKVPLIPDGLKAVVQFSEEGIKTNVTLCFSGNQALLAAKAGATYISPFVGRLDDKGQDGMALIEDIIEIYKNYPEYETQVLVASIRHPMHVHQAAMMGADVCTIPFKVFGQLVEHPLTDLGLKQFLKDGEGVKIPRA